MQFVIKGVAAGDDPRYWAEGPDRTPSHWPQRPDLGFRFGSLAAVRQFLDELMDQPRHPELTALHVLTGATRLSLEVFAIDHDGVLGWQYDQHSVYYA